MPVKVNKDLSVTLDDTMIGYIEKRVQGPGLFETVMGVSATSGGKVLWFGFAADGTQLTTYGEDTRKAAVRRIEKHAEPLAVNDMKLERGLLTSGEQCITASVTVPHQESCPQTILRARGVHITRSLVTDSRSWEASMNTIST